MAQHEMAHSSRPTNETAELCILLIGILLCLITINFILSMSNKKHWVDK